MTKPMRIFVNLFVVNSKPKDAFFRNEGNMFTIPLKRPSSCPTYNDLSIQIPGNFWKKILILVDPFVPIRDLESLLPSYLSKLDPNFTYNITEIKHIKGADLDRDYLVGDILDDEGDLIAILEKEFIQNNGEDKQPLTVCPVFKKTKSVNENTSLGKLIHRNTQDQASITGHTNPQLNTNPKIVRQKGNQFPPSQATDQTLEMGDGQDGKVAGEKLSDTLSALFNKPLKSTTKEITTPATIIQQEPKGSHPVTAQKAGTSLATKANRHSKEQNKPAEIKPVQTTESATSEVELKAPIPLTKIAISVVTPPVTPPVNVENNVNTFNGVDKQIETEFINSPTANKEDGKKLIGHTAKEQDSSCSSSESDSDSSSSSCSSCERVGIADKLSGKNSVQTTHFVLNQNIGDTSSDEKEEPIERPASNMPEPIIKVPPEPVYKFSKSGENDSENSGKDEASQTDIITSIAATTKAKKFSSNLFAKVLPPVARPASPPKPPQSKVTKNKKKH